MKVTTRRPNYCDFGPPVTYEFDTYEEFIEIEYIKKNWLLYPGFIGLYYDILHIELLDHKSIHQIRLFSKIKPESGDGEEYFWMGNFIDQETPKFLGIPLKPKT